MKLQFLSILVLTVLHQSGLANSANIIFWAAFGSQSTRISQWPLIEALADKGHNVTYLSPLPLLDKDPSKKSKINIYTPKKWAENIGAYSENFNFYETRKNRKGFSLGEWTVTFDFGKQACDNLYSDPEFMDFIKSNKFDFVIMDTCNNECAYGPIHMWNAKYALYDTTTILPFQNDIYGMPDETSSIPDMSLVRKSDDLTFRERMVNQIIPLATHFVREYSYLPYVENCVRNGLGPELSKGLPSFQEMDRNTNLVFLTSHHTIDYARSVPPNAIHVGGNVIAKAPKPLPKEMKEFLDKSPEGFMYISFGTGIEFSEFDKAVQIEFINALRQFPKIRFLWKSSTDITAAPIPDNVMVSKWVPQQTILQHPKLKAFITHNGMGSTIESIHFAIPLICIPILYDQEANANFIVKRGAGVKIEIVDMKQKDLADAITEILQNKKYAENMKKYSAIFKDRPAQPMETAIWWIEYVLRHDNTNEYLIPPSAFQPWWKRRQVDVWAAFTVMLITATIIPLGLIACIIKKLCGKTATNSKSKLKTN